MGTTSVICCVACMINVLAFQNCSIYFGISSITTPQDPHKRLAGEGKLVGVPKFHSWSKYTVPLMNINSDGMSNASSGLHIARYYLQGYFNLHLAWDVITRNSFT